MTETVAVETIAKKKHISREKFVEAALKGSKEGLTKQEVCDQLLDGMHINNFNQKLSKMNAELLENGMEAIEFKTNRPGGRRATSFVDLIKKAQRESAEAMNDAIEKIEKSA